MKNTGKKKPEGDSYSTIYTYLSIDYLHILHFHLPQRKSTLHLLRFSYPRENSPLVIRAGVHHLDKVFKNVLIHTLMRLRRKVDSCDTKTKGL